MQRRLYANLPGALVVHLYADGNLLTRREASARYARSDRDGSTVEVGELRIQSLALLHCDWCAVRSQDRSSSCPVLLDIKKNVISVVKSEGTGTPNHGCYHLILHLSCLTFKGRRHVLWELEAEGEGVFANGEVPSGGILHLPHCYLKIKVDFRVCSACCVFSISTVQWTLAPPQKLTTMLSYFLGSWTLMTSFPCRVEPGE